MSRRQLRPRKQRPSYRSLLHLDDDEHPIEHDPDRDSGSDFAPNHDDDDHNNVNVHASPAVSVPTPNPNAKGKAKATTPLASSSSKPQPQPPPPPLQTGPRAPPAPALAPPASRQMHALPTPSIHHRHRAIPIFTSPSARTERLAHPPRLFAPPSLVPTNAFTSSPAVTHKLNKACGHNVGPGPLWDLLEDRAWFKEARVGGAAGSEGQRERERGELHVWTEPARRPLVYEGVRVGDGWEVLNARDAAKYLPTDTVIHDEAGTLRPPPPVKCYFGPVGSQTPVEMRMFEVTKMSNFLPESKAHVFNTGGPVWGLDWCPVHPDDRPHRTHAHYLAVAPFPSRAYSPEIGARASLPAPACIQVWVFGPSEGGSQEQQEREQAQDQDQEQERKDKQKDKQPHGEGEGEESERDPPEAEADYGVVHCAMVLCLEYGPAHEIKWCPLPAHDYMAAPFEIGRPRKLGILAVTHGDGSLAVYAVPEPADLGAASREGEGASDGERKRGGKGPVFVRIPHPLLHITLEETACWSLDWANSEVLAVGCTNGTIAVYDIGGAIKTGQGPNILPTHYISVHQSAIRALAWIRAPRTGTVISSGAEDQDQDQDPTVIASGGYDGVECLTDIREGCGNVMNRARDVISALAYSPYVCGPITMDHENYVKAYAMSPSMLGRGHTLLDPGGPVWTVGTSDYHPQLAVGSADGVCATTNTLRFTRRGTVPFLVHKIFQMDYSRASGEFRMLDRFLPYEPQDRTAVARAKSKEPSTAAFAPPGTSTNTGVWPPEVGVHRVTWHNGAGLEGASLLAAGTASGLVRVDWLVGRWFRGRVPYQGVEGMRGEGAVGGSEGGEVDDDEESE